MQCREKPSEEAEMASQTEDRILEALKKVGAHVDSAVGAFTNLSHFGQVGMQTEVRESSRTKSILILKLCILHSMALHLAQSQQLQSNDCKSCKMKPCLLSCDKVLPQIIDITTGEGLPFAMIVL